jgi:hypothetical protein
MKGAAKQGKRYVRSAMPCPSTPRTSVPRDTTRKSWSAMDHLLVSCPYSCIRALRQKREGNGVCISGGQLDLVCSILYNSQSAPSVANIKHTHPLTRAALIPTQTQTQTQTRVQTSQTFLFESRPPPCHGTYMSTNTSRDLVRRALEPTELLMCCQHPSHHRAYSAPELSVHPLPFVHLPAGAVLICTFPPSSSSFESGQR